MLKAILYYILLIAEYMITLIIGGLAVGFYVSIAIQTGYYKSHQAALESAGTMIIISFTVLAGLIVWLTFSHYKFSKFSLGKVVPQAKWKAMTYLTLPILGITMAYYAILNLQHIDFMPKEMTQMNFLTILPFAIVGSFISAYVFYGAIQEELIRCGKKLWVQTLTLCIMMLPLCLLTESATGNVMYYTVLGMVSTVYGCWAYQLTRSSIVLYAVYLIPNLVPSVLTSTPICFALILVGIAMTLGGGMWLKKHKDSIIAEEDEDE